MRALLFVVLCSVALASSPIYTCSDTHEDVYCPEPNAAIYIRGVPLVNGQGFVPVGTVSAAGEMSYSCDETGAQLGFTGLPSGLTAVGARGNCSASHTVCDIESDDVVIGTVDIVCE